MVLGIPTGVDEDGGWVGVDTLVTAPARWDALVAACLPRFGDGAARPAHAEQTGHASRALVAGQVVREVTSTLVAAACRQWSRHRVVLDVRAGNVLVRLGPARVEVGLRSAATLGEPGVDLADLLLATALGTPARGGAFPPGAPARMPTVAALVAVARRSAQGGGRHHWGTAALALSSALTAESHEPGRAAAAEADRRLLLARRPDLARTLELVTVADARGEPVTAARRRTCCLLLDLPAGRQCGTCSLRDREACLDAVTRAALAARDHRRKPVATG